MILLLFLQKNKNNLRKRYQLQNNLVFLQLHSVRRKPERASGWVLLLWKRAFAYAHLRQS